MAKKETVYNERAKQKAAYDLLKSLGQRVKPRFEDYLTGRGRNRSLINRANKFVKQTGEPVEFKTGENNVFRYRAFTQKVDNISVFVALNIAQGIITINALPNERVRLIFSGMIKQSQQRFRGTKSGIYTVPEIAVSEVTEEFSTFESVDTIVVNFRLKIQN